MLLPTQALEICCYEALDGITDLLGLTLSGGELSRLIEQIRPYVQDRSDCGHLW
jgi:hypothetical protein